MSFARQGSQRNNQEDGESIYFNVGMPPSTHATPIIKQYNVAPVKQPVPTVLSPTGGPKRPMHADSSQVQQFFNPIQGPRDAAKRAGMKPPDHSKSNIRAIRELSSLNQMRKQEEQEQEAKEAARRNASGFVRTSSANADSRRVSGGGSMNLYQADDRQGRDFLKENKISSVAPARPPRQAQPDDGEKYLKKKDFGRVPTYLLERKLELVEQHEADLRAREAAMIPAGMRLLSEEERVETLLALQRNKGEVQKAMQALPLRIETHSQIRWRDDLERRMREVDKGIKVFSRPKVLVQG